MKKLLAILLTVSMLLTLGATALAEANTEITLWTYPIGDWGKAEVVDTILAKFNAAHPEITVKVEYLDYTSGDDQVTSAIEAGTTPDIIMEGPERLVSNWAAKGKMLDISDLWTDESLADIAATSSIIVEACKGTDGKFYEYPLCMTTHCMAINYEVFEQAGALEFLDLEKRTWTTDNFVKALEAVKASGLVAETGVVYCGGQGGDQGTRALASNLYSAQFANPEHTMYTMDSDAGKMGLNLLVELCKDGNLSYDAGIVASDELQLFANGTVGMSFCWNASNKAAYASAATFTPYAMAFPSDDGMPELVGGIWGFGLFNNGDDAKAEAAKTFIKFVCDDPAQAPESVYASGFFPVRASLGDIYTGTEKEGNKEFTSLMMYLGDFYNLTPNWTTQRTEWWNMLQRIFGGEAVDTAIATYIANVNVQ